MSEELGQVRAERDVLRREVTTLAEQLKHLVRAEHALTRARRESDRQLERIKRLARFAFDIAGVEQADEVLGHARCTLLDQFELDEVVALEVGGEPGAVAIAGGAPVQVERAAWELAHRVEGPGVGEPEGPIAAAVLAATAALGVVTAHPPRLVVWLPLRSAQRTPGLILVGWTSRTTSHHRALPGPEHLPFLQVVGEHVARAMHSAQLTTELRRQGAELSASNGQLQASLRELEATQAQLVQAQKLEALGRLAGGIAHDFNNLLTVIMSHAELLRATVRAPPEAIDDLATITEAAQRATEITKRLLAFGRQREHSTRNIDLNAATIDLSRVLRRLIGDHVVLQLDLDPAVGLVSVDAVHLEQMLMNLVVNARDAMPRGGKLTLQTRRASHADRVLDVATPTANLVALAVHDTGIGMDEATRSQVFEPFFTTKPVGQGTGLGLATVYGLAKQNGGAVTVTSERGKGSSFTVFLPSAEAAKKAEPERAGAGQRGTILVAEDEDAIRRVVCRVLRKNGFEVVEARDGVEAMGAAERLARFDLVVTDVVMPNMGGPELVKRLRERMPGLRAVFVSGHTFDRLDVERLEQSVEAFLAKPFLPEDLLGAVSRLLGPAAPGTEPSAGA